MPKLPEKHLNFASLQSSKRRFVYLEYVFMYVYLSLWPVSSFNSHRTDIACELFRQRRR